MHGEQGGVPGAVCWRMRRCWQTSSAVRGSTAPALIALMAPCHVWWDACAHCTAPHHLCLVTTNTTTFLAPKLDCAALAPPCGIVISPVKHNTHAPHSCKASHAFPTTSPSHSPLLSHYYPRQDSRCSRNPSLAPPSPSDTIM